MLLQLIGTLQCQINLNSLFLHEFHEDLIHVLLNILEKDGKAIIFAPERGETRKMFLSKVKDIFSVSWVEGEADAFVLSKVNKSP